MQSSPDRNPDVSFDRESIRKAKAVGSSLVEMSHDRYALQLLTPASILATIAGRTQIELDDIQEMGELFLDAKTSAAAIGSGGKDELMS